jgi:hypothetical protein
LGQQRRIFFGSRSIFAFSSVVRSMRESLQLDHSICEPFCLKLLLQTSVFLSFEGLDGGSFVVLHQSAVAGDVGAEEGGELAVKTFLFHAVTSLTRRFGKSKLKEISPT